MKDEKKIEIVNPNKPPVHEVCPFLGNLPVLVPGGPGGQGRPDVLPIGCQKTACMFWCQPSDCCKIEKALDIYINEKSK